MLPPMDAEPQRPAPEALPEEAFLVDQPGFQGTLGELAYALRGGALRTRDIDLYRLVRDYLAHFDRLADRDLGLASEALPRVAQVIELKTRLLLPRPPREEEEDAEELELDEALEAVALLEELEEAIDFLRVRREERKIVLPARAPRPPYPRPERPLRIGVQRLAEMASRYRSSSYFELAVDRLTMASAMKRLLAGLRRLRRGLLRDLAEAGDWATRAVYFAGMLELVKEGSVRAEQEAPYAPIEVELAEHEREAREVA